MKTRSLLAVFAVLPLSLAACGSDDDSAADVQQVTVVADDYVFTNAPEFDAGVIQLTLENNGAVSHEVAFVEIGDTPIADFPADFLPVFEGGPFPDYADAAMAPLEVEGGKTGTVTFTLGEGTYALFCALDGDADAPAPAEGEEPTAGEPHLKRGMIQSFTVGAGDDDAVLPEADGTITANDYTFDVDVVAGDKTINFDNDGPDEIHFAGVNVFPEGTTAAEAEEAFGAMLSAEEGSPLPEDGLQSEDFAFSGVASPGLGVQFSSAEGAFESGRTYIVACFISDRAGGPPHAIGQKMYKAFTVA